MPCVLQLLRTGSADPLCFFRHGIATLFISAHHCAPASHSYTCSLLLDPEATQTPLQASDTEHLKVIPSKAKVC